MTGLKLRMFGRAGGEKSSLAAHAPIGDVPTAIPPSKPLDKNFRRFICVALPSLALNFSTPPMRHLTPLGNHSYFVAKLTPRQVKLVSARPEEAKLQAPCPRDNCFLNSTLDQRAGAIGKSDKMSLSAPPHYSLSSGRTTYHGIPASKRTVASPRSGSWFTAQW